MRYTYATMLLILCTLFPVHGAVSAEVSDTHDVHAQINAIHRYIERALLPPKALRQDEYQKSIRAAVEWFQNAQEETGHFRYEYVPYRDEYLSGDNIVRQAGALYALGEIERRDTLENVDTEETVRRAIEYFERNTRYSEDESFGCIEERNRCKLGATSLALTGILGYIEAHPDTKDRYETLVQAYKNFILEMKKEDAGFRDTHHFSASVHPDAESPFSNGEALLALTRYYLYEPDHEVREVIDDTYHYLSNEPYETALYLWMMAALKDMHVLFGKDEYLTYGKAFTDWRLDRMSRFKGTVRNYCAPIEGVVSAYSLLESSLTDEERRELRGEIDFWNAKNAHLQLTKQDRSRIFFTKEGELELRGLENKPRALGGFLTAEDEPTQRIDFTQHCVTAYVQALVDIDGGAL